MIRLMKLRSIKVIALMISLSMVMQSAVWADPSIIRLDNLQVESTFSFLEGQSKVSAGYLVKILEQIEEAPHNRDIISVGKHAEEVIRQIIALRPEIGRFFEVVNTPENGVVLIKINQKIGDRAENQVIIRYFNPAVVSSNSEDKDIYIGRYLHKEVITGDLIDVEEKLQENKKTAHVAAGTDAVYLKFGDHVRAIRAVKEDALAAITARERLRLSAADKGMKVRTIDELGDNDKPEGIDSAIIGVDWNTPLKDKKVSNDSRIRESIPTFKEVIEKTSAKNIFVLSHLGRPAGDGVEDDFSMILMLEEVKEIFKDEGIDAYIEFLPYNLDYVEARIEEIRTYNPDGKIIFVMENQRFYSAERSKDREERLAHEKRLMEITKADVYIGEAFGKVHRGEEASMEIVNLFAPVNRAAGVSLENEIEKIIKFEESVTGKIVAVFGGAKFEKFETIGILAEKVAKSNGTIVMTGALANAYLYYKYKGQYDMTGAKMPEGNEEWDIVIAGIEAIEKTGVEVVLPKDFVSSPQIGNNIDIGPLSRQEITELIESLGKGDGIIINGGTGVFEEEEGVAGTVSLISDASKAANRGVSVFAAGADMNNAIEIVEKRTDKKVSDKIIRSTGGGALLAALAKGVMELSPVAALVKTVETDETTFVDKGTEITPQVIIDNAEKAINGLVNALTIISKKDEKVVLALDTELGKGEINRLLQDSIKFLPKLSKNNEDLARLLRNLIVIKGEGAKLSERLEGDLKSVKKENFIIIAKNATVSEHFNNLKGISIIAGIDDSKLSENDYIPLLEIMYFSIGKYFGWSTEKLHKIYSMIPNVKTPDSGDDEHRMLFDENSRQFLFRIIPDAAKFDTEELRELMKQLRTILTHA